MGACVTIEREETFTDEELKEAAGESSDQFRGIVLFHAFLIVQHDLRITKIETAKRMGFTPKTAYHWIKNGIGETLFFGYLVQLELLRQGSTL